MEARKLLGDRDIAARVVSVPSLDLFLAQPADYRQSVLGEAPVRIAIEAGIRQGWDEVIGANGTFIGMTGFGASAPYKDLYKYFGITAEAVVAAAMNKVAAKALAT